jgi:hypothetical protein
VRNSGGTVIATGTTPLPGNNWSYIEIKGFINGASGTCEVHLNGNTEIASTVGNFGSSNFDGISYAYASNSSGVGVNGDFDDIYVADTSGSAPRNTFLGDTRVETLYPSADGANQAWTPNSGSPHFSRVNEHTSTFPDDDTSYVSDLNSGDRDTYVCDDLSVVTGNVFAVQTNLYARKDDAGLRQVTPVIHQGGVDYDGNTLTLGSNYAVLQQIYNQDPTSADWTPANVNADEFGIKVV